MFVMKCVCVCVTAVTNGNTKLRSSLFKYFIQTYMSSLIFGQCEGSSTEPSTESRPYIFRL